MLRSSLERLERRVEEHGCLSIDPGADLLAASPPARHPLDEEKSCVGLVQSRDGDPGPQPISPLFGRRERRHA
jgi:hypothetical protein